MKNGLVIGVILLFIMASVVSGFTTKLADNPHPMSRGWLYQNQPPVANFTASSNGLVVMLNAASSYDPDGYIVEWMWDFGDGTQGTGETVLRSYPASGSYNVTLTVRDDDGLEDSITQGITLKLYRNIVIFGRITNVSEQGDDITFEAVKTRLVTFSPFNYTIYISGEKFTIFKAYEGFMLKRIMFAWCKLLV